MCMLVRVTEREGVDEEVVVADLLVWELGKRTHVIFACALTGCWMRSSVRCWGQGCGCGVRGLV